MKYDFPIKYHKIASQNLADFIKDKAELKSSFPRFVDKNGDPVGWVALSIYAINDIYAVIEADEHEEDVIYFVDTLVDAEHLMRNLEIREEEDEE